MPIRPADATDVPEIRRCVLAAYARYSDRLDRPPEPLFDDYEREVRDGWVFVDCEPELRGLAVLTPAADHLWVRNLAVRPELQGQGLGSRLLKFAEARARALNLREVRLCTNERMTENLAFYAARGYRETHRAVENGYARVFFAKTVAPGEPHGTHRA